jgi:ElaB/YqjD/DUF883 family membrane-anchored ribosome-binding protein
LPRLKLDRGETTMTEMMTVGPERVMASLRQLIAGAEDLLAALRKQGGEHYRETMDGIAQDIERARELLDELQDTVAARARTVVRRTDRLVRAHPWETAGATATVALLLGVTIGLLAGRALSQR